jgi:hypothetical protein
MSMVDSKPGNRTLRQQLLIVSFEQFGYHTDSYEYCRYLGDRFRITYLCPDQGLPRTSRCSIGNNRPLARWSSAFCWRRTGFFGDSASLWSF